MTRYFLEQQLRKQLSTALNRQAPTSGFRVDIRLGSCLDFDAPEASKHHLIVYGPIASVEVWTGPVLPTMIGGEEIDYDAPRATYHLGRDDVMAFEFDQLVTTLIEWLS